MRKWILQGCGLLTFLLLRTSFALAAGASGLPWDEPLTTVSDALWGTPSHAIMTAVIVFAGLAWA
jgi:type IV secretory pathway VirB2 component (pilin)